MSSGKGHALEYEKNRRGKRLMEGVLTAFQNSRRREIAPGRKFRGHCRAAGAGGSRRGSVLLIVLISVAFLTLLVVFLIGYRQSADYAVSAASAETRRYYTACGGLEMARAILREDLESSDCDTLGEYWASRRDFVIEGHGCSVEIVDENSKLNIEYLANDPVVRVRMVRLISCVVDGIDFAKAATMVETLGREIAEGVGDMGVLSRPEDLMRYSEFNEALVLGGRDEARGFVSPGLVYYVTVQPCTGVNINTASREVMLSLSEDIGEGLVDRIIAFRSRKDDNGETPGIASIADLPVEDGGFSEEEKAMLAGKFVTASDYFTATVSVSISEDAEPDEEEFAAPPPPGIVWIVQRKPGAAMKTILLKESGFRTFRESHP